MTHRSSSFSAVICHTVCCFIGYSYCFAFFPSSPSSTSSQQSSFWCSAPSSALGVVQPGFWYLSSVPVLTDCQIPTLRHFPHWPRPDPSIVPWAKLFPAHLGASWAHLSTRMKTLPTSHMQNSSCPAHYTHTSLLLCRGHCLRNLLHTSDQCSHPYIPADPPKTTSQLSLHLWRGYFCVSWFWLVFCPFIATKLHDELLLTISVWQMGGKFSKRSENMNSKHRLPKWIRQGRIGKLTHCMVILFQMVALNLYFYFACNICSSLANTKGWHLVLQWALVLENISSEWNTFF